MLGILIKKYDIFTIVSFLCIGFIFGLNGCVQSSILLNFYQPKIICQKSSNQQIPYHQHSYKYHTHQSHKIHNIKKKQQVQLQNNLNQIGYYFENNECHPCKQGLDEPIKLVKDYSQIYSMVEQFQWFCMKEKEKILVMSIMASGLFIGFLTHFLVGDSQKMRRDQNNSIIHRSMRQILCCLYVQSITLLLAPLANQWFHVGFILFIWNFGYSFFYSSVYSFIGQRYGTLIVKYSSTIYHAIWSIIMIGFLIFIRFFGDWRDNLFYFNGIPQTFFVICLTISLYFQQNLQKQNYNKNIGNNQIELNLNKNNKNIDGNQKQLFYFNSDLAEYVDDPDQGTKNQQQTFVLSRFQTEDFLLTVQANQSTKRIDSHNGSQQSQQNTLQNFDSFVFSDNARGTEQQGVRKPSQIVYSGKLSASKNQIFENIKQKKKMIELTPEQLKQQQEQFIINSDLNVLDMFPAIPQNINNYVNTENDAKSSKQNIIQQSQPTSNIFERQDSTETQNTVKQSQGARDIPSLKLIQNHSNKISRNDEENNQRSSNTGFRITTDNSPNKRDQSQHFMLNTNQFDFREYLDFQKNNYSHNSFQNQASPHKSIQTLSQPNSSKTSFNNIEAIRNEMKIRWLQLKRDPSQKMNILIFLCCWIQANVTNYGIYIQLLSVNGDIYMKITLCVIIEIISNYIASYILINFQLRKVILYLFLISGLMCCATFWMDKTSQTILIPILITKLCMELFFPIKTYFLQFVLHSQYFKISLGLGDALSTFFQAPMPLLIYISSSEQGYFLSFTGITMILCVLMISQIKMINIYGLNLQFQVFNKEENKQSNIMGLAEIMEVDSAADISLYSFQSPNL